MPTTVYAAVFNSGDTPSDYTRGCNYKSSHYGCHDGDMTVSHHSGEPKCLAGKKKNYCLQPNSKNTKYNTNFAPGIPCGDFGGKLAETPVFVGGHSVQLLKCKYNVDEKLLQDMSKDAIANQAGYNGVTIYQQLLSGMNTDGLNVSGYCDDNSNYLKEINIKTNQTCKDVLDNDLKSIEFCKKNPTNAFCACYNIAQGLDFCKKNPKYPGCTKVMDGYNMFTKSGATIELATTCYAPDVCSATNVYKPDNIDACKISPQFCTQINNLSNVEIQGNASVASSCKQQQTNSDEKKSKDDDPKQPTDPGVPPASQPTDNPKPDDPQPPDPTDDSSSATPPGDGDGKKSSLSPLTIVGIILLIFALIVGGAVLSSL